ncbi:peroxisomal leader peptide-processing protease [Salarias fasciatus]|uniref:Peroxisomal leader peptide-processing protease n=1 Tax=Salarias fasciatus TaxID=181472 RepID=A0A672GZN0_SALFA|nr:peroxisomal leader peptide-processing protease [Salarias fasciatus]
MELKEVERCCCVVKVSEAVSAKKSASCSGVVVHPQTGTIICTGLPFSRFLADKGLLSSFSDDRFFLPPRSFTDNLQIRVNFAARRGLDSDQSPPRSRTPLLQGAAAELLMLVNCVDFKRAFQTLFQGVDQWRFHGDETEDEELIRDAQLLSWFAVLRTGVEAPSLQGSEGIPRQSSSALQKGCPVVACGSPFGSVCLDLFISTLSRGIVSNLAGEDNAVILTDARCLPGTEGGGLFAVDDASERVRLIGIIVSPFGWKASEWIGLTLVCSVQAIFKTVINCLSGEDPLRDTWQHPGEANLCMSTAAHGSEAYRYPTVCFVDSGQFWGSGVAVTSRLVVTCRHVANGKSTLTLKFHHKDRVRHIVGDVVFSTKASSPYDLALVEMRVPFPEAVAPRMAKSFTPGQPVVVVGYGGLGRRCGPSLTSGVLSKAIILDSQPVMLQTTCAVQAGASGGAVVEKHSGELLGIVSSNARDLATEVTYPHLNFCIPVTVFQNLLQDFRQTGDVSVFGVLDSAENQVRSVWRLQGAQSKL